MRAIQGARLIAEEGRIEVGANSVILENAVLRARPGHDCILAENCLVGPNAHIVGARVERNVFMATSCAIFHGSHIGANSVIRIQGIVHIKTRLASRTTVPVGWAAIGDPAVLFLPDQHEALTEQLAKMDFAHFVYGVQGAVMGQMDEITARLSHSLGAHKDDEPLTR